MLIVKIIKREVTKVKFHQASRFCCFIYTSFKSFKGFNCFQAPIIIRITLLKGPK